MVYREADLIKNGLKYFNNDILACNVWVKKYALKASQEGYYEESSPEETIKRMTSEIYRIEQKYNSDITYEQIHEILKDFKYFIFGGSILFGLGNNNAVSSLGNCFFIDNNADSYGGIFNMDESMVQLMKRRGGVGITIEHLRPSTSRVNNSAHSSTGAVSFMNRYSTSTREVAQDGRRGALMITCDISHPDITDFVVSKDDLTKITGANISVKITNEFMEAVEHDKDYILSWPKEQQTEIKEQIPYNKLIKTEDGKYIKRVKAKDLWNIIVKQAHKNAEPGLLFWDNVINESPADAYKDLGFETKGTNPCVIGDTLIAVADGRNAVSIRQLVNEGKDVPVYSTDPNSGQTQIKYARNPRLTQKNAEVWKLKLDDGSELIATPDHKILTSNLEYKQLKDLSEGESITPFYLKVTKVEFYGYEDVYNITVDDNHNYHVITSTNDEQYITSSGICIKNCGEVPLSAYDSCRLGSINLSNMVLNPYTSKARIDWDKLSYVSRMSQRFMDNIVDLEEEKIIKIINKIKSDPEDERIKRTELELWETVLKVLRNGRRTGVGVLGMGDMFSSLGIKYGTPKATKLAEKIHKTIAINSYKESVKLAKERGAFEIWNHELEATNPFIRRVISNNFSDEEYEEYLKYGRRNIATMSIAPTGSLAILSQTTSGIEPVFKVFYRRKRKINPNENGVNVSYVDENGDSWEEYNVIHYPFIYWFMNNSDAKFSFNEAHEFLKTLEEDKFDEIVKNSPWYESESHSVDYIEKINMQGAIQKWVDHSISVTHNLPENITVDEVQKIYFHGWKSGCKGITIYREGSRLGVLTTSKKENKEEEFVETHAPKRPKSLDADYYVATVKGTKFAVIIGKYDERPYEIFAFENPPLSKNTSGKIIKVKKGHYKFINGDFEIDNLQLASDRIEERTLTLTASMLLRHGAPINNVDNVIKKIDENITSFSSAIRRYLHKYVNDTETGEKCPNCDDKLIMQDGCVKCVSPTCGYSKCG